MARSTVFRNHTTQAVRLPKAVALPDNVKEVEVTVVGDARIITPADRVWDTWFAGPGVTDDFMVERAQPPIQERNGV